MNVHFSSKTNEWATPQDFYDKLHQEFNFSLDVAATPDNAKCDRYFTETDDGLDQSWDNETVFCNPPYGRTLRKWVEKASSTRGGGRGFIGTSTHRYVLFPRFYLSEA